MGLIPKQSLEAVARDIFRCSHNMWAEMRPRLNMAPILITRGGEMYDEDRIKGDPSGCEFHAFAFYLESDGWHMRRYRMNEFERCRFRMACNEQLNSLIAAQFDSEKGIVDGIVNRAFVRNGRKEGWAPSAVKVRLFGVTSIEMERLVSIDPNAPDIIDDTPLGIVDGLQFIKTEGTMATEEGKKINVLQILTESGKTYFTDDLDRAKVLGLPGVKKIIDDVMLESAYKEIEATEDAQRFFRGELDSARQA